MEFGRSDNRILWWALHAEIRDDLRQDDLQLGCQLDYHDLKRGFQFAARVFIAFVQAGTGVVPWSARFKSLYAVKMVS